MQTDLEKLAERCEAATGPGRELERAIWYALADFGAAPECDPIHAPRFTASLDAAMTLVPEGLNRIFGTDDDGAFAQVGKPGNAAPFVDAATEALALTAAALRAQASLRSKDGK